MEPTEVRVRMEALLLGRVEVVDVHVLEDTRETIVRQQHRVRPLVQMEKMGVRARMVALLLGRVAAVDVHVLVVTRERTVRHRR